MQIGKAVGFIVETPEAKTSNLAMGVSSADEVGTNIPFGLTFNLFPAFGTYWAYAEYETKKESIISIFFMII